MCGSKAASTNTAGSSTGTSTTKFAQGPTEATGKRYENFLDRITPLAQTPFDPTTLAGVAPLNPNQNASIQQMFDLGTDMGKFDPAQIQQIMSPYIQDVVGASQNWFNNQNDIQANTLLGQGIRSGNAFGGDRAGVAAAELAGQQQLAQAPVIAGLYQSGYGQALNEYNTLKQFGLQGAQAAITAGTVQQAQAQRELDIATANALQKTGYPFQVANWEGAALGGIAPLTGTVGAAQTDSSATTTGESTPPSPTLAGQVVGGVTSLAGLGSSIFPSSTTPATSSTSIGGGSSTATGFGKHGGRVGSLPQRFAYGGQTNNFEDEQNYAGYGYGDSSGDRMEEDSSSEKKDEEEKEEDKGDKVDVLEAIQKVGEQKPEAPKPPPSPTGKFEVKRKGQPYIGLRIPGYGVPGVVPQTGGTPQAPTGGSSFASNAGGAVGGALGSMFGPVGTLFGGAAGRAAGSLFGKDGGRVPYYEEGDAVEEEPRTKAVSIWNDRPASVVREIPTEPPAEGTGVIPAQPVRPSIPTPDPLARYLGTEGPRSLTGPARGSPAGFNPQQAREVAPSVLTRERVQRELQDNPRLARTFDANTTAEVGVRPVARQGYQAATIDRAGQLGVPLRDIVNNPNYYPWSTRAANKTTGQGVDESIWAGANPVNYGTGNASYDPNKRRHVGFAGGPQTASIGAERYGIEGQSGLDFARARGYTGPDRTAIGFGPGAPVGSQGVPLQGSEGTDRLLGGDKGGDDLERPQRGGPFGTGPLTTHRVPELGRPPRDSAQRWAVNPLTHAGIAMLRSQSPYFGTALGEGLAGAAGAIEHSRAEQVLDSKPVLSTDFPTLGFFKGDGTWVDSGVPNPAYDAKSVARDRLEWDKQKQRDESKQDWKATGFFKDGVPVLYNARTGQYKLAEQVDQTGKVIPATPAPVTPAPPTTTTEPPAKTAATWMPNLGTPDPNDPLIKDVIPPDRGPESKQSIDARNKANYKKLEEAQKLHATANAEIGRMNQLEEALNQLPATGFLSPGALAGYNATIASSINHGLRMIGSSEWFTPEQVAAMEESTKLKYVGAALQSRLGGGGTHVAQNIMLASMRAYPGAEQSPQGAALILNANREVAQHDRDLYEYLTKYGNTVFKGDLQAATLAFDRIAPMEKYIERARAKVEAKFGPNPAPTTQQKPTTSTEPQPAIGARRQFKQGWGVWDGQQWQPERQ